MSCLLQLVWLIPALPVAAALAIWARELLGGGQGHPAIDSADGDRAERFPVWLALSAAALAFLGLLVLDAMAWWAWFESLPHGNSPDPAYGLDLPSQVVVGHWLTVGVTEFSVSFSLDRLSLTFATLFAFLGGLAQVFSTRYMHREAGFARYFAALSLYLGAMLLIALSGSVWLSFVGWELAGVSSFLLVGYARERPQATGNALFVFLNNRIGDAGFLLAIGLASLWVGSLEWPVMLDAVARLDTLSASLVALGLLLAAFVKSGQVPFSPWLVRALDGPTPSSGIFYGCLTLHIGVFLVLRLEPLLQNTPEVLWLVALLGVLTTLYGALVGLTQTDIKSSLVHSALAQVGLMFTACGLGYFEFAAWHLAAHSSFRLWQFLSAPSWLDIAPGPQTPVPVRLRRWTRLHAAARESFGLEAAGRQLISWPTARLARDLRTIDQRIIGPVLGSARDGAAPTAYGAVLRRGLPETTVEAVGRQFAAFEALLLVRKENGSLAQLFRHVGNLLEQIDRLLAEPRYLFLFIMATLVVIL